MSSEAPREFVATCVHQLDKALCVMSLVEHRLTHGEPLNGVEVSEMHGAVMLALELAQEAADLLRDMDWDAPASAQEVQR